MYDTQRLLDDIARVSDGDYAAAFKMLGFVTYLGEHGAEQLLSGALVSPRTYYRWVETIRAAGWGSLLAQVRLRQAMRDYLGATEGEPDAVRQAVLQELDGILTA